MFASGKEAGSGYPSDRTRNILKKNRRGSGLWRLRFFLYLRNYFFYLRRCKPWSISRSCGARKSSEWLRDLKLQALASSFFSLLDEERRSSVGVRKLFDGSRAWEGNDIGETGIIYWSLGQSQLSLYFVSCSVTVVALNYYLRCFSFFWLCCDEQSLIPITRSTKIPSGASG